MTLSQNRRGILIATTIVIVVGILAVCWMFWRRADQRFVGAWSMSPADTWSFGAHGGGDRPKSGRFRWQVTDNKLQIWWQPWSGWQDQLNRIASRLARGENPPVTMEIVETTEDRILLRNKQGVTLTLMKVE
jgi:hypothetical protein